MHQAGRGKSWLCYNSNFLLNCQDVAMYLNTLAFEKVMFTELDISELTPKCYDAQRQGEA
jgi:hypothetical protein